MTYYSDIFGVLAAFLGPFVASLLESWDPSFDDMFIGSSSSSEESASSSVDMAGNQWKYCRQYVINLFTAH
jgi:hypothetical protein